MCVGTEVAIAMAVLKSGLLTVQLTRVTAITNDGKVAPGELGLRVKCESSLELFHCQVEVVQSYQIRAQLPVLERSTQMRLRRTEYIGSEDRILQIRVERLD